MRVANCLPIAFMLLLGCARPASLREEAEQKANKTSPLTAGDAKQALKVIAPLPRTRQHAPWDQIQDILIGGSVYLIDADDITVYHERAWTVCLPRKEFHFCITRGPTQWCLDGRFEMVEEKWTAVVVNELVACSKDYE
jgi:hypothetical protein